MSAAALTNGWQKSFQLEDGRPTGRWQWVIEALSGPYYFPGYWLEADAIVTPPDIAPTNGDSLQ